MYWPNLLEVRYCLQFAIIIISFIFCVFPVGPPDPPTNCSVVNQTTDSLEVECLPGFNGGLEQKFVLEVTDLQTKVLLANATDKLPEFTVSSPTMYFQTKKVANKMLCRLLHFCTMLSLMFFHVLKIREL